MKKISIITVNKDNKEGLKRTIISVLNQTVRDFEFIVIDGASTDGSVDVIKEYNDHITYWVSEPDKGIYNAMNKGIQFASSNYCLFLNSGDCFCHDNVVKEIFQYELTGDIICGIALFEANEKVKEHFKYPPPEKYSASDFILDSLPHQSTLIKTELFKTIHTYDETYQIFSDWAFNVEMLLIHRKKYQSINVLISRCDSTGISSNPEYASLMNNEFDQALKTTLPEYYNDYKELAKKRSSEQDGKMQILMKLGKTNFFRILIFARKKLLRMGFFKLKNKFKTEFQYLRIKIEDRAKKKEILKLIQRLPQNILPTVQAGDEEIIISLTSYGKRVKTSVPYAIYSLFQQDKLPNRIVLFLDSENWNDRILPTPLKRLKESGLEIYYCPDIRSYKKLVPALEMFPNSIIVTVDDDVYYNPKCLYELYEKYLKSDKRSVICHRAAVVEKVNGKFTLPTKWRTQLEGNDLSTYSAIGVGGVLYPPGIFDNEIYNREIFHKLAPTTDDLWFWVMEIRNNIRVIPLINSTLKLNENIDRLNQMDNRKSDGLFIQNCLQGGNDKQLNNLLEYYQL